MDLPAKKYVRPKFRLALIVIMLGLALTHCAQPEEPADNEPAPTASPVMTATPPPLPTETPISYPQSVEDLRFITVAIDAPSRNRDFAVIDEYGYVQGYDPAIFRALASSWNPAVDVEFVVTPFNDLINPRNSMLTRVIEGEFDAAMAEIIIPDVPEEGIAYTAPYLEIGQVLVVRANEASINRLEDLSDTAPLGVALGSRADQSAREILGHPESQTVQYDSAPEALQGLIDGAVSAVLIDSDDAEFYVDNYYQQLRLIGDGAPENWIAPRRYGIAVAADNVVLLNFLNQQIETLKASGDQRGLQESWLVTQERLVAGESLIGTLEREFVVGLVSSGFNLDPAAGPEPISWEIKTNIMAGLVGFDAENQLVPRLAEALPTVSPDGLEYTIKLRAGLQFPDGSPLTADDVRYSILRSAGFGNFLVNAFLKDENIDGFADDDSIEIVDPLTVRLRLDEPASYFLSVLATPPYFIISDQCFTFELDPSSTCGGIGPYIVDDWEVGQQMRLRANPQWPGEAPTFDNIQLRFYQSATDLQASLANEAIDLAWSGLPSQSAATLRDDAGYKIWEGPGIFKSYLVFEHLSPPWTDPKVRQAAALAVDRDALSALFGGGRKPLYSAIPNGVPGYQQLMPTRNLDAARALLAEAGFSETAPATFTLDYVTDGRYSTVEEGYAQLIADQLEETGLFRVELRGAPYDSFRALSATCESDAFLLGWPPSGQPPYYNDPAHWTNYFVFNTDTLCSNYDNAQMATAIASLEALDPGDLAGRNAGWTTVQSLWASEYPTLDLTQEIRIAVSLDKVTQVKIDAQGFLRYDQLDKSS